MSYSPIQEFSNRRILVTGASGSIGGATAIKLAEAGAHVVLNGRDEMKLQATAAKLPQGSFTVAPFDLTKGDDIVTWLRGMAEKDGPFSGIAHTAGFQSTRALRVVSAEFIMTTLRANVTSSIMLGKALRQKACHTEGASYVLMSSTAAFIGGGGNVPYAASKGAVIAATKAMAHELVRDKIRVNCVVSGLIAGEMAERARAVTPPEAWKTVLSGYPMGIGQPDDIAAAILYLLSGRSSWMTGTDLQIDGGLSIV